MRLALSLPSFSTAVLIASLSAEAVTIDLVPIGNAGNAGKLSGMSAGGFGPDAIVGGVAYDYWIGTTEVTNGQYVEFLNAKAASDPLGLYNTFMGSSSYGGITRGGSDGSYTYSPKINTADKPINYVNWYDAIRFANWLHNGQGTGDTETGAYTLLGGTPTPSNGDSLTRKPGAIWFLPSEDEWHKAAYYDPTLADGDGGYWDYPTRGNVAPTVATLDSAGAISNPGANVANYNGLADRPNATTSTVGSAGPLSESYYGTSDQGGNVYEWIEALSGSTQGVRGGGYLDTSTFLRASTRSTSIDPTVDSRFFGLRVGSIPTGYVPEPSTATLAAIGLISLALASWRRKRGTHSIHRHH